MARASSAKTAEKPAAGLAPVTHSFPRREGGDADALPIARRSAKILARGLKAALQPIAPARLSVEPGEPFGVAHDKWLAEQGTNMGLAIYQLPPAKGRFALRLPHAFIGALVDAFFGGSIARTRAEKSDYSSTDMRLMQRIATTAAPQIATAWAAFGPFRCLAAGLTDDPEDVKLAVGDAPLMVQPFKLKYPDAEFDIELVYPVELLRSVHEEWAPSSSEEVEFADPAWREQMGLALAETNLSVRCVLARPTMTLPELANLKPGDLIPIPPARNLPLLVGDRAFARGSLGEQNGLAAFRIDTIEKG